MARARNIKFGFFTNDELAEISFSGRLLFIGLWCLADRDGRMIDKPRKIKGLVFPFDKVNVDKLLRQLADKKFIVRYEIRGEKYIQIVNFDKHQNPHIKEPASIIPAPDKPGASTVQARLIPDPGSLIPDPLGCAAPPRPVQAPDSHRKDSPKIPDNDAPPPASAEYKIETPLQRVVCGWKFITGVPKDDRAWDKLNWSRTARAAKELIEFFGGNLNHTLDCCQDVYEDLTSKKLTCTIETVKKFASDWRTKNGKNKPATTPYSGPMPVLRSGNSGRET